MFIDKDFFYGLISIGGLASVPVQESLQWHIDTKEDEYLRIILGSALYDAMKADLVDGAPQEQRFIDLKDQLVKTLGTSTKISPAAYYVYFFYQRSKTSSSTPAGEKKTQAINGDDRSPFQKQAYAWNEMVKLNYQLKTWLNANASVYPEYVEPERSFIGQGWFNRHEPRQTPAYNEWINLFTKSNPLF